MKKITVYTFNNGVVLHKVGSMTKTEIKVYEIENDCKLVKKETIK